jgi:hypothetical protein
MARFLSNADGALLIGHDSGFLALSPVAPEASHDRAQGVARCERARYMLFPGLRSLRAPATGAVRRAGPRVAGRRADQP